MSTWNEVAWRRFSAIYSKQKKNIVFDLGGGQKMKERQKNE